MFKKLWRSTTRYVYLHVIHADDTPHRVAKGVSIGLFIALLPVFGIQMALAFFLAAWTHGNRILAVAMTWLSNPFTSPVLYWSCWKLGHSVLRIAGKVEDHAVSAQLHTLEEYFSTAAWSQYAEWGFWSKSISLMGSLGLEIWIEIWVGCVLVGALLGVASYYLTLWFVSHHRAKRAHKKAERRKLAAVRKAAKLAALSMQSATPKNCPVQA